MGWLSAWAETIIEEFQVKSAAVRVYQVSYK